MAEPTTLTTRIISKHITFEQANTGTWKPYEGEIVLARVDTQKPDGHGGLITVPTYLMKVGAKWPADSTEGTPGELMPINKLQWAHALASDVYGWAKQSKLAINDPDASDSSKNVITNIVATDAGITITRASVATSDALATANEAIQALQGDLNQEKTDRAEADTALDNKITAINNNLEGTTEGTIGKRLSDVEGVASTAASTAAQNATNLTNYKAEMVETLKSKVDTETYTAKMAELAQEDADIRTYFASADDAVKAALIGATGSTKDSNTITGAKLYADSVAEAEANDAETAAKGYADGIVAAAQSTLQGKIDTLGQTVGANESANSTAHEGFNTRIGALEGKVANVANVMDFVGIGTATVTEGVISITVEGVTSFQKGDVVATNDGKEYVYDGSEWHEFGYVDDTKAAVASLKESFETFRDNTVPNTYATKGQLTAEQTARETAISGLETAYKADDASLKSQLEAKIGTDTQKAYDDAVARAGELDAAQTATITAAYEKAIGEAKSTIESDQAAVDAAQDKKITDLENVVGDANSGLVKDLADEIVRAKAAEKLNSDAIATISGDYLKTADKTELEGEITTVANNLSTLSGDVTANKQDVDTNFLKNDNGILKVGGDVIVFDCGGAEKA